MTRLRRRGAIMSAAVALAACGTFGPSRPLTDRAVLRHASTDRLPMRYAQLILGNDAAFRAKLQLVESATRSIDAMYYIYADDYSSSVLSDALIAAARRGVRVRLLLDYHTNYHLLDHFTMMEKRAADAGGSLEVRFYNRPTRNIVMDAAFVTIGCGGDPARRAGCSAAKFAEITRRFDGEQIDGRPAADLGISNLDVGNSGIFLSGLYAKRPGVMALAVLRGQDLEVARLAATGTAAASADRDQVRTIARLYWNSRTGDPFTRLVAQIQLAVAFSLYGEVLNPIHEALSAHLPLERPGAAEAARDWEYLTDFLHHKLLLADGVRFQLGGRNIEDSYHMRPNGLLEKYVFVDTDINAGLEPAGEAMQRPFDALWGFRTMVASTEEIRRHAPNDFVANEEAFEAAAAACRTVTGEVAQDACVLREFGRRAVDLAERERRRYETMRERARQYWTQYPFAETQDPTPTFWVEPGALIAYVENLPFYGQDPSPPYRRAYGAKNGEEDRHGKHIHALWLAGLAHACRIATAETPQRVILHNAYVFPASNLIRAFARMMNGDLDCRHVTVTILTNSLETTDLNIINLLARHATKAFAEHYQTRRDVARSARFELYEYRKLDERARVSLHSKIGVIGGDVLVGSANADVRSYMMDANNGLFIRGAPRFTQAYVRYVDGLLSDQARTQNVTNYYATTPRAQMIVEDRETVRALMDKYRVDQWLDVRQREEVERRFIGILEMVYELSRAILGGGRAGREAEAKFNRIFKPL